MLFRSLLNFPRKCSWLAFKKKNRCLLRRKEVCPPNTRAFDNLKTDADRKHERLQACRRHLHGGDISIPRTSASSSRHRHCAGPGSWREGSTGRERSLQNWQLRCRVFCKLYCRCIYSTLRESSIVAQEVSPCTDICMCVASAQLQRKRSSD